MDSQPTGHSSPSCFRQRLPVLIAFVAGLIPTIVLFLLARDADRTRIQLEFDALGADVEAIVRSRLAANVEALQSVTGLYAASREVDRLEFKAFTQAPLENCPGLRALAWAPRVPASDVAAFERQAVESLAVETGYRVAAPAVPTTSDAVPPSTESAAPITGLFPVLFVEPHAEFQRLLGTDLAESDACREAISNAAVQKSVVAIEPATHGLAAISDFTAVVFSPIYNRAQPADTLEQRRANLQGMAVGLLDLPELLQSALPMFKLHHQEVRLIRGESSGNARVLFQVSSGFGSGSETARDDLEITPWEQRIGVGGLVWRLVGMPTPQYIAEQRRNEIWAILIVGLLFTLLLSSYLNTLAGRAERIRIKVEQQTGQLRESEERHRAVVERLADGITLVDADTLRILDVNAAFARLVGYEPSELLGKPISDFIVDTPEGVASQAQRTRGAGAPIFGQRQYRRKDGSVVDVEKSATVLQLGGRQVLCTVIHDVTERKRADEAIRASEERTRRIVETAHDAFVCMDEHGIITDWNAQAEAIFGWPRQEVIGRVLSETIIPPRFREQHEQGLKHFMQTGHGPVLNRRIEVSALHRGGHEFAAELSISPLRLGDKFVFNAFVHDITERKKARRLLEEKNQQLEKSVQAERAAMQQLQQTQGALVQSEKLAGLGQMVAGVAHEINNPLSFVANNVAVLERDMRAVVELIQLYHRADPLVQQQNPALAKEIAELIERVDLTYTLANVSELTARSREGLRRIQQIVKDLRDFARLDQGDQHDTDLNAGIESTVNIILGRAKKKRVEIVKELNPIPPLTCHAAKVNQVVMNLIANAIDASPEGGKVTIRTQADNGSIRISVTDQGHGIDPAVRERIFDPFFTTKPPGEGTGLGLSISYGIIKDHGGRIEVESAPGEGAAFTIHLPVR